MYISKRNTVIALVILAAVLLTAWVLTRPKPHSDSEIESDLVIDTCYYKDSCGSSKLLSVSMIEKRGDERLVEAVLQRGDVVDPDNDNFSVEWNEKYTMYALCSGNRPRIAFESDSTLVAEEFDVINVPGVSQNNANLYLGICHGTLSDQVRKTPYRFGYQPMPNGARGQFNVSKSTGLFE